VAADDGGLSSRTGLLQEGLTVWYLAAALVVLALISGALLLGYGVWRAAEMLVKELVTYRGATEDDEC